MHTMENIWLGLFYMEANLSHWIVYPLMNDLVLFFFPHCSLTDIGLFSAVIGLSYQTGILLGFLWFPTLREYCSARRLLLASIAGSCICSICFGLASSFYFMAILRCLWGLFTCRVDAIESYLRFNDSSPLDDAIANIRSKSSYSFLFSSIAGVVVAPLLCSLFYRSYTD